MKEALEMTEEAEALDMRVLNVLVTTAVVCLSSRMTAWLKMHAPILKIMARETKLKVLVQAVQSAEEVAVAVAGTVVWDMVMVKE